MVATALPRFNMDNTETGCCPLFDPTGWDGQLFEFGDRPFVRATTINFMHFPLNMGSMVRKTWAKIQAADAATNDEYLMLSTDPSPWRGEHFFAVTKQVPNAEMTTMPGVYLAKVFEGPYRDAGKWAKEMESMARSEGRQVERLFFFYTTCPKCAKHYGKNYVVAFAKQ